tara:strand:+ start:11795 stop:12472 length:678 start_codon:yes stop_codon:yes gene_type:complete
MWSWFVISTSILSLVLIFRRGNVHNGVFITHPVGQVVLKILGLKLDIENYEKLETSQPCVYISNHQSLLDVFTFCAFFPHKTFVVAKKSLRYTPFFGWGFSLSNNIYIDRKNRSKAVKEMAKAEERIRQGWSFFVFPEGTRSRGKGLGQFKKGAFHVAMNTGVPIVPWICQTYRHDWNSLKTQTIKMKVLDPFYLDKNKNLDEQIQKIRNSVLEYLNEESPGKQP